jgi:hypothetical protein
VPARSTSAMRAIIRSARSPAAERSDRRPACRRIPGRTTAHSRSERVSDRPLGSRRSETTTLFVADTGNHTRPQTGSRRKLVDVRRPGQCVRRHGRCERQRRAIQQPYRNGLLSRSSPASTFSYVSDTGNNAIRRVYGDGDVEFVAGGVFGYANGTGAAAQFRSPAGMALRFSDASVFVADPGNHCIRHVTFGGVVTALRGPGHGVGKCERRSAHHGQFQWAARSGDQQRRHCALRSPTPTTFACARSPSVRAW